MRKTTFALCILAGPCAAIAQWNERTYEVTFTAEWSAPTHPTSFPPSPHFSGIVGAIHSSATGLWESGQLATPGIKSMAETGSKTLLLQEVNAMIGAGSAWQAVSGNGIGLSPGSLTFQVDVRDDFPLVTIVSMIAPSPDWFVGTESLNMRPNGHWEEEIVVDLYPWDAGTDSGVSYTSGNLATIPAAAISSLQGTSPFVGTPRIGTLTFSAQAYNPSQCYFDCDSSGTQSIFDYICFGNAYASSDPYADCDANGQYNVFDYICFGSAYAAGCQ